MAIGGWFRRNPEEAPAEALYGKLVAQARRPEFYAGCGVPDTVDGRFDLIALHLFLVLHRLKRDHPASAKLAQAVFDTMFHDMDQSLREMGAGDLGVGRRVKAMIQGLYGRIAAYETGLGQPDAALHEALRRNLYGTTEPHQAHLEALAAYMRRQVVTLAEQGYERLSAGEVVFGEPPAPVYAAPMPPAGRA
jgi:cytochrome b pre-mRNA-processing protein 3